MIAIFADEIVPPNGFQVFLSCVMYTVVSVSAVGALYKMFWGKEKVPQPLSVTRHALFADKDETEKRFAQIEQSRAESKLETDRRFTHVENKIEAARIENKVEMDTMRREAIDGRRGLHKDIEHAVENINARLGQFSLDITGAVGELKGEVKRINGANH